MGINPPTVEQVENAEASRYQSSPYLDEVNALKEEIANAERQDRKPDLSDFHPTAIREVDASLLTKKQAKELGVTGAIGTVVGSSPLPNPNYPADAPDEPGKNKDWRVNTTEGTFTREVDKGEVNATSETDKNENETAAVQDLKRDPKPAVKLVKADGDTTEDRETIHKIEPDPDDKSVPPALKATEVDEIPTDEPKPKPAKKSAAKKKAVKRPPASKAKKSS